jgi:hypothetical protein
MFFIYRNSKRTLCSKNLRRAGEFNLIHEALLNDHRKAGGEKNSPTCQQAIIDDLKELKKQLLQVVEQNIELEHLHRTSHSSEQTTSK